MGQLQTYKKKTKLYKKAMSEAGESLETVKKRCREKAGENESDAQCMNGDKELNTKKSLDYHTKTHTNHILL